MGYWILQDYSIKVQFSQSEAHSLQGDGITHLYHATTFMVGQESTLLSLQFVMTAYINK
jgi:hypothetical protein